MKTIGEPRGVIPFGMRGTGGRILAEGYVGEYGGVRLLTVFDAGTGRFITTAVTKPFQEELLVAQGLALLFGG